VLAWRLSNTMDTSFSLKHEDIYLKHYADGREARAGIASWIAFYNNRRPH
jgi:putative transposase